MTSQAFDLELDARAVQALSNADAVAGFFTKLGYNTAARTPQTAANLSISEAVARPIKRIELIADQDRLLQVYLFEVKSVTVAAIRDLARSFRNFAGSYLLVLTSDYEQLDFVLLHRQVVERESDQLAVAQATITPRRISVDRRKPLPVHLRVLRRFTWTEPHALDQFEKLRFAYDLAYWSEVYFNNRALFSDHYLLNRLRPTDAGEPEFPEWLDDPKPAYQKLRALYDQAGERFAGKTTGELCEALYEPVFRELGFAPRAVNGRTPLHMRLFDPAQPDSLLAVCLPWPWGRELDRKDETRDSENPDVTPAFAVVDLLATEKAPWVILTNGKVWRLYSQRAHSRATNYYEVDLHEVLGRQSLHQDVQDAFRYFWIPFRMRAFRPEEREWQGKKAPLSMLDRLLLGSEDYARHLGENLKARVFTEVFPHLAEGFIAHIRRRRPDAEPDLEEIFQATLTLLYRLLFLLYAESRDLLPVRTCRRYFQASLERLKKDIGEAAGTIGDETEEKIKAYFRDDSYELWKRLKALFSVIDKGDEELNVPRYNGGLFQSERDPEDDSPEARAARFLEREKIPDRYLALPIDLLARDIEPKRHDLAFIDYKSLGVRQLGSIYEGLLEFHLRIADQKLAIAKEKGREVYVPFRDLAERDKERAERQGNFVRKGRAYLENDKRERKATGSYYTPDHIVDYIVEHAVGPVLEEKLEAMRPRLREAQHERREFDKRQQELIKRHMKPEPASKAGLIRRELVDELFNIKVLDPAMGSGHFLVEAVDFITDKILEFLNAFPWNPVQVHLRKMRETISKQMEEQNVEVDENRLTDVNLLKRHVLKRCMYGVDLNPMAVELAKVSLWLDCFTLGAPLSFLDHHLRCGNSLIGSTVEEVDRIRLAEGQLPLTGTSEWTGLEQAVQNMVDVGGMPDITAQQITESKAEYKQALARLEPFKRVLDLHTARWFVVSAKTSVKGKTGKADVFDEMLRSGQLFDWAHGRVPTPLGGTRDAGLIKPLVQQATTVASEKRFFHWELEFPEVFYGRRPGTLSTVERLDTAGFDAVVGNPPWGGTLSAEEVSFCRSTYAGAAKGPLDTFALFIERSITDTAPTGRTALLLPDIFLLKNYPHIRKIVLQTTTVIELGHWGMPFKEVNLDVCSLVTARQTPGVGHLVRCLPQIVDSNPGCARVNQIAQDVFLKNTEYRLNLTMVPALMHRVAAARSVGPPFGDLVIVREGVHSGNVREKLFLDRQHGSRCAKLIFGRDEIAKLKLEWHGRWVQLDPRRFNRDEGDYFNIGQDNLHRAKKILVRRTGDEIIAALDAEGFYSSNNFFLCVPKLTMSDNELAYCVAVLNSSFATWYFRAIQPRANRLFAELKITHLTEIPIPFFGDERYREWISDVGARVLAVRDSSDEARLAFLGRFDRELSGWLDLCATQWGKGE